jgi:predicted RNA-binding Zn ribbon-like protein
MSICGNRTKNRIYRRRRAGRTRPASIRVGKG